MKKYLLLIMLALALVCTACAAQAERTVVTSFYPIYIFTENVLAGCDGVTVKNMTAPTTGCLHDYQLLAGDMRNLAGADVFCVNGGGMESFLGSVRQTFPDMPVIDCSAGIDIMEDNAHMWLSAQNAILMVKNLQAGLSQQFPDLKAQIDENAENYIARLTKVDEEMKAGLADIKNRKIVTFHEAFPYFAEAYGLDVVAVVTTEPDQPLSPSMLRNVIDLVDAAGDPPLFTEPQYDNQAAVTIAAETGAKIYPLDPIVTGDGAMTAYEDVMRQNLQTLREALGAED